MTLKQDLRFAVRMLVKDKWFTLVAILALGLGIGVNTTVFTFVNAVLIRGLPFPEPGRILHINTRNIVDDDDSQVSHPELEDWRAQTRAFAELAAYRGGTMNVSDSGHPPERTSGSFISANAFRLLRQPPQLGRDFAPGEDQKSAPPVVILGHGIWKTRYGGDPSIVGRVIKVNEVACTVIGVMPEGMRFPTNTDMWRPLVADGTEQRRDRNLGVFGRLAPGVSRTQAQTEMSGIAGRLQQQYPDTNKNMDAAVMTFNERFNGGPIKVVFLSLLGAVGFVLLIACANVANLLLSRSVHRSREIAVRVALGASRVRVIRQLLVESTLLACVSGALGLGLALIGIRLFDRAVSNVGKPYWISFTLDPMVFGYLALVCLATGIIFGLAPAMQVSKANVNEILKEGGRGNAGGTRARRLASAMVVAEITLTLVLLFGAGLMIRSFLKLYSINVGVDTSHMLTMRLTLADQKYPKPEHRRLFYESLLDKLKAVPGVQAATLASSIPLSGTGTRELDIEGRPAPAEGSALRSSVISVSDGYFSVMGRDMLRGRTLRATDGTDGSDVVVVNERFATKFFPGEDPIGRRIKLKAGPRATEPDKWLSIVGIAPTIRQGDQQAVEPEAVAYLPYRAQPPASTNIITRSHVDPASLTTLIRQAVQSVDPDQPVFNVRTMEEVLVEARWPYRVFGSMFTILAIIALVLSSVGIYAVTAYSVTQRTQEIGVRMALGAQGRQVSWLILRQGLIQLAIGLTLGLAASYPVGLVLKSLVVQIPPADPVTAVAITVLLAAVTITACVLPARRATRLDPLTALRVD